ncbi:hypothetical protein [Actinoplanes sp. NPDC051494]|uniref:hypothetical protein n=1 Tax=Actinoplanes sp. NPDC051494 TaxID=3363907 RepID=UPI0037AF21EE
MTEDLRALMRSELNDERPPPLGDLVATAMRDGRRITRNRRLAMTGAAVAVLGVVAGGGALAWPSTTPGPEPVAPAASAPVTRPTVTPAPATPPTAAPTRSVTVSTAPAPVASTWSAPVVGKRVPGKLLKATPQAVLELLTQLLPKGRTSAPAANADDGLFAQVHLDTGNGPGLIRVRLDAVAERKIRPGTVDIETSEGSGDCTRSMTVTAWYPDGGRLRMDVATCLADGTRRTPPALTRDDAVAVVSDARWGLAMDAELVTVGAKHFADVPRTAR